MWVQKPPSTSDSLPIHSSRYGKGEDKTVANAALIKMFFGTLWRKTGKERYLWPTVSPKKMQLCVSIFPLG